MTSEHSTLMTSGSRLSGFGVLGGGADGAEDGETGPEGSVLNWVVVSVLASSWKNVYVSL